MAAAATAGGDVDGDFMELRPEKGGARDLFHLLWSPEVDENAAVDCPAGTQIAEARRRWAVFVSLVAQMLLLWAKRPVAMLGRAAEYWMNLLNENGGGVLMLLTNALQGTYVVLYLMVSPRTDGRTPRTYYCFLDFRIHLDCRMYLHFCMIILSLSPCTTTRYAEICSGTRRVYIQYVRDEHSFEINC